MDVNKMTAVEWLVEQLKERGYAGEFPPHLLFDQAKEMEKEQIELAFRDGWFDGNNPLIFKIENERYYNETYGK